MIFVQHGRPAMAFTSENLKPLMQEIAHTERDAVDIVDYTKLAEIACALRDVIWEFSNE